MSRRFEQIPIAFDQLVNTLFGGWADETISSAAWRKRNEGYRGEAYKDAVGKMVNEDEVSQIPEPCTTSVPISYKANLKVSSFTVEFTKDSIDALYDSAKKLCGDPTSTINTGGGYGSNKSRPTETT